MSLSRQVIDLSDEDYLRYNSPNGSFFLYDLKTKDRLTNTIECREEIEADWTGDYPDCRTIGLSTGRQIDVKRVATLWAAMEKRLHPQIKHPSTLYAATVEHPYPTAVLFNLSTFWIKSPVRRSVATLMIRLIVIYCAERKLTFAAGLKAYHLTAQCSRALKHFFTGYTKQAFDRWNSMWWEWDGQYEWDVEERDTPEPYDTGANEDTVEHQGFCDEMSDARPFADIEKLLVRP